MDDRLYSHEPWLTLIADMGEPAIDPILFYKIEDFEWSARTTASLKAANIIYLGDLIQKTEVGLLRLKDFGRFSLSEINQTLKAMDLSLDARHPNWPERGHPLRDRLDLYSAAESGPEDSPEARAQRHTLLAVEIKARREAERARIQTELATQWPDLPPTERQTADYLAKSIATDFVRAGFELDGPREERIRQFIFIEFSKNSL